MNNIKSERIRTIIKAGLDSKKTDPASDLTPSSYKKIEEYIINCENRIINLGGELPKVIY